MNDITLKIDGYKYKKLNYKEALSYTLQMICNMKIEYMSNDVIKENYIKSIDLIIEILKNDMTKRLLKKLNGLKKNILEIDDKKELIIYVYNTILNFDGYGINRR